MSRFLGTILSLLLFLSFSNAQSDHVESQFILSNLNDRNIVMDQVYITDHYTSQGITHTYFKQSIDGIPVFNSRGAIHYKTRGQIIAKPKFIQLPKNTSLRSNPTLSIQEAILQTATKKNLDLSGEIVAISQITGDDKRQTFRASKISLQEIQTSLHYYVIDPSDMRLVWSIPIEDVTSAQFTQYLVDAHTGAIVEEISWTVSCDHGAEGHSDHKDIRREATKKFSNTPAAVAPNTYEVFAWPVESPNFGTRTVETSPWNDNLIASPDGWHTIDTTDYTTTRGNNTDTYLDEDTTNSPTGGDAARADGGANLEFIFPLDVDSLPTDYKEAAVTNCFYWTNLMHDVWFNYGFDEPSGNFQQVNFTDNPNASDYVYAEVQDGSGTCNANFGTPPDGFNPRMQMYLCTKNGNFRDGDLDNGVIAHEYGHGISNRMTGGPSASSCLGNAEQMGEGWSDYFGMVMTIETGDSSIDSRGMGTWLFGQGPTGNGIRPYPYSTDFGVNPMTYNTIKSVSVPHGVGSVWCTMLWDLTWALIDEYGFDTDIYEGTGGNNIAMQLVMEGIKLQPCRPGFVDGRDAILLADELINGGANKCIIWNAFATRGLGFSADQGASTSRSDGTQAFDLPIDCDLHLRKTTPTSIAEGGDQVMYDIIVSNNLATDIENLTLTDTFPTEFNFISASDGGTVSGNVITFPIFDLNAGVTDSFQVTLEVKPEITAFQSDIFDNIEGGTGNWNTSFTGSTNWSVQMGTSNSGTSAWFAPDNASTGTAHLDLAFSIGLGDESKISFYHKYDTEKRYDGGQVFISKDGGVTWTNLSSKFIHNGYNDRVLTSFPGFSGDSDGFINSIIDLSSFGGQNVLIRFQMNCDGAVGGAGWWIDDFTATNMKLLALNKVALSNVDYDLVSFGNAVQIDPKSTEIQAQITSDFLLCNGDSDGMLNVTAQGGSGSFTYLWEDSSTNASRTNLSAGIYNVTVDDGAKYVTLTGIVAEFLMLSTEFGSAFVTNVTQDNGIAETFALGGKKPLFFSWSNGGNTSRIDSLAPGTYYVTITDFNGCQLIDSIDIGEVDCGDDFYDLGGATVNYSNSEDFITTLCSPNPDEAIKLTFNSLDIEANWDALYIHNGSSISSPLFASNNGATQAGFPAGGYYGTSAPGPFTSTDSSGCLTVRLRSDQYVTGAGWDSDISCTTLCAEEVSKTDDDGWGTLRRQIFCADPIDVIAVSTALNLDTINLLSTLIIDKDLVIDITTGNIISIVIGGTGPVFQINALGKLDLNRMKIIAGSQDPGGAIINDGMLILKDVDIFENSGAPNPSGLLLNNGQLNVQGDTNIKKE